MNKCIFAARQLGRDIVLRLGGFAAKPSNGIHILNGHMAHPSKPDIRYMENTMGMLSKIVQFVRIEDAIRMIENHEEPNEPLCAFTFDDGYDDCYHFIAPVLERYGTNALFFVNPNYVAGDESYIKHFTEDITLSPGKRPMRWEQLKELHQRGFIIGAHTMDHYLTANDDKKELKFQIVNCKSVIEEQLGTVCETFAWPYGRFKETSEYAVELACKSYKYVFSQTDYTHYYSFDGRVINRRHFEPFWPASHIRFFLSRTIHY